MKAKKTTKTKRGPAKRRPSEGLQDRNKEMTRPQTSESQWDQGLRAASALATSAAQPSAPPMPNGWNDEQLYTENKGTGAFTAGELGQPDVDAMPDKDN